MTANTAVNHVELCLIFFNYSCLLVQSLRVEPTSLLAAWAATTAVDPSEFFVSFMLIFVLMFFFPAETTSELSGILSFLFVCFFVLVSDAFGSALRRTTLRTLLLLLLLLLSCKSLSGRDSATGASCSEENCSLPDARDAAAASSTEDRSKRRTFKIN